MKRDAGLPLTVLFAGLCLAAFPATAAPGFVASGVSGPAPRFAPMRPIARPGHAHRHHAGIYRGGYPGFYGWPGGQQTVIVLPETSEPPPVKEPSIPVAIGIPRPPAADPVLYRIETYRGRPVVRVMRFGSDGRVARR
ncbi:MULTISPECIES: hypothetical protein [unclassified Bosea (in: a-proteobacteria)]|uniref:hypothetical protein n=1 Tax=unclassified Bosea (in: a-proteobacteria) TaxID=2653178 RepID=UPI000F7D6FDC|nr:MULTISPECIES: hypothetical protein [unclassified Bosea (in: a-proteobacteria)]RXT18451.1 hypothetical protein B5U98_24695 [Bosea sp. Tri-39]RXT33047.1 hypothetical protein B5U99_31040 [Bosea sp. Tri-54]